MDADRSGQASGTAAPAADAVRAELTRIFASTEFARSPRLQRFLRYVVEETLQGRGDLLKEYSIAIEAFDRDASYDSQTNALVRVEASRLRAKLDKYNAIDGRDDPVHIGLPAGGYVPVFAVTGRAVLPESVPPAPVVERTPNLRWVAAIAFAAAIGLTGLAAWHFSGVLGWNSGELPGMAEVPARPLSIAVLPFRNLSGNSDNDYLSAGMTDALITSLAKQQSIRVISLTSTMVYKNAARPVADIARELNVSHVAEGSILRSGARARITAQLIEAATSRHLWAESYERDVTDILPMQDDVARRIVAALSEKVERPLQRTKSAAPADLEAQEAYLKGRYFRNTLTEDGFRKGITYFRLAISKAPTFAAAYSGMAACYCLLGGHGFELVAPRDGIPDAKKAVLDSLRLDDSLAEPHAFLGIIRLKYEWDWPGAEDAFRRAIRLNPSYAEAHVFYSFFLEAMERQEEAIREAQLARTLDPLSLNINVNLGWQYIRGGKLEQARQQFEKTRELRADFWGVHWGLGHYHRQRGALNDAIEAFEHAVKVRGGHALPITDLGYTYAIAGRPTDARRMLDRLKTMAEKNYVSPYNMATIHIGLGELDDAFAQLERAFEARSRSLVWLNVASEYDVVRSDPRFKALLRRIGLPTK